MPAPSWEPQKGNGGRSFHGDSTGRRPRKVLGGGLPGIVSLGTATVHGRVGQGLLLLHATGPLTPGEGNVRVSP